MAAKILLVCGIFVYLLLVSLVCAYTYPDSDVSPFGEDIFYEPIRTHNVNVSAAMNLSDLEIVITKGRWILNDGALESDSDGENEFFIKMVEGGESLEYNLSSVSDEFCVFFYRSSYPTIGREDRYGYFFHLTDDLLSFVDWYRYLYIFEGRTVLDSTAFGLSDDHPTVTVTLDVIPGGTPEEGGIYGSVSVDGNVILRDNYAEDYTDSGYCAGVYTKQKGLKVVIDRDVKSYDREEVEMGFDIIPLMMKLIFFHAPEIALPLWLNLIMFKLPVLASVLVVITIVRGV